FSVLGAPAGIDTWTRRGRAVWDASRSRFLGLSWNLFPASVTAQTMTALGAIYGPGVSTDEPAGRNPVRLSPDASVFVTGAGERFDAGTLRIVGNLGAT